MSARTGERHPSWKGGSYVTAQGYRRILKHDHPAADRLGYVLEHRLVLEKKIGRLLRDNEVCHHINGDRLDNRPENLELMTRGEHTIHHRKGVSTPRLKPGQWSLNHERCVECGKTDSPHSARGVCHRCYEFNRRERKGRPVLTTWARDYDCCTECGTTERRHAAHGLCCNCYSRQQKRRQKT